ncbi:MAG: lysophospholipid acyltransferase family protein [Actinomycetota bacterium]|nr:lysophospholipid acyltransferase family protein [Actinomycetota bacterium]MDA3015330.1 lysophospholipid acyltransferase family protein [Actinomycetota bacterium]MDA3027857.1 lysophospholipid acyltransferase family protein [Actinomycetota bacterium]
MSRPDTFLAGNSLASRAFYRFGRTITTVLTRTYTRMSIHGRHNIPATGAFVLAPVHRSYVDTPIAACVTSRRLRFLGKDSMWKYRWFGWVLSALGAIPVTRGTADREALRRSVAVLEAGDPLVLFPEGERKSGSVVQPMFDGAVYVALKAGVPIVPVGIGGSEMVMPKGARFVFPRKVRVVVGEPLMPETSSGGRVSRSELSRQSERLHAELQRLFDLAMVDVGWSYGALADQ